MKVRYFGRLTDIFLVRSSLGAPDLHLWFVPQALSTVHDGDVYEGLSLIFLTGCL